MTNTNYESMGFYKIYKNAKDNNPVVKAASQNTLNEVVEFATRRNKNAIVELPNGNKFRVKSWEEIK
jgi:hypothetical protein